MVELAIVPTRPTWLLKPKDRDPALGREPLDLPAEAVADRPQQRRRRDLLTKMAAQEPHDLPADLQVRDVRVQVQPVDTLNLKRHMALEHVVDVRDARHPRSMTRIGPALPARRHEPDGGRPGGGPAPLPLIAEACSQLRQVRHADCASVTYPSSFLPAFSSSSVASRIAASCSSSTRPDSRCHATS